MGWGVFQTSRECIDCPANSSYDNIDEICKCDAGYDNYDSINGCSHTL